MPIVMNLDVMLAKQDKGEGIGGRWRNYRAESLALADRQSEGSAFFYSRENL